MSSQQFAQEIKQDIQNIRRTGELNQQTIVTGEAKVITSAEQSIAQELPIVTEKLVTKEFVPVTYEKIIQKIPVVVGQRVETGAPISQEKYVQGLNVEYVQGAQQTRVDLTPQMTCQSTGVQEFINQPLNMAAEKISQQVFTEAQTGLQNQQFQNQNQQFQNQQFQNQQFQNQQFQNQNQQFQNKQFLNQQNLPQQQFVQQTEKTILEAAHLQPGQVFGQEGFVGQPLQQGGLGQQGLLGQQGGLGQQLGQKERNLEADLTNIERNLGANKNLGGNRKI